MKNQILKLSIRKEPNTLDPQKCGDMLSSALIFLLFKGLTRLEANGKIIYDLADSVQISHNDKIYIFKLGRHFWNNGAPITAYDFDYSWKRALHPDFPLKSPDFFYSIKNAEKAKKGETELEKVGVHARDAYTLIVELEQPCSHFLELTSFCPLFPIARSSKTKTILSQTSGPFQLHEYTEKKEILLVKNSFCRNRSAVQISSIHFKIVPNEMDAFSLYEKGELDWIGGPLSPLPLNYLPSLFQEKKIKPVGGINSCFFNVLKPFFNSRMIRKSLASAFNHEKTSQKILSHNVSFAPTLLAPIFKHFFSTPFNPSSATTLFAKAQQETQKIPGDLSLIFEGKSLNWLLAKTLKTSWKKILSLNVRLEPLSFKELSERLFKRQFDIAIWGWFSQITDPINVLELFERKNSPKNISGWEHSNYLDLLKRYRKTSDYAVKQNLLSRAGIILENEVPAFPLCYCQYSYLQKPYLKNLAVSPIGLIHFDQVIIDKKAQDQYFEAFN